MRRLWIPAGFVALLAFGSCSPSPEGKLAPVHDLVAELPLAEVRREVGRIDFGTPAGRAYLRSGWHENENTRHGTFVWSKGETSVLEFFLTSPRDLRAEIRCIPYRSPDGSPQAVSVEANGQQVADLELRPGLQDYTVELPGEALTAGTNLLSFRYRHVSQPRRDNGRRRLAVKWDVLRFRPALQPGAEEPQARAKGSSPAALYLPFGAEVTYYLDLPSAGVLSLEGMKGDGGSEGRLELYAQEEGEEIDEIEPLRPGTRARSIELPGEGGHLLRLTLRAVAERPSSTGGLLLEAPAVLAVPRPAAVAVAVAPAAKPAAGRPNIIIYLVDTLRADHLGCYGSGKPLSPNIDAFAEGATLFEDAVAQAPWTRPSVTSILTGLGPLAHGVQKLHDRLPDAAITLPELLRQAGYRTAAFSTNWHISEEAGLSQGFDDFFFFPEDPQSDEVTRRVVRWLDANGGRSPFFLYIHSIDPHAPYTPPADLRKRFAPSVRLEAGYEYDLKRVYEAKGKERAELIAELLPLYDAEVASNDRSFGVLVDALRARGLYDDALILFVADHGEEFDDHGEFGHGHNFFRETLSVPLIVKKPHQTRGERVDRIAQHADLMPTLLGIAGVRPPDGLHGADLFRPAASGDDRRRVISHLSSRDRREGICVTQTGWKLVQPLNREMGPATELYDRLRDPGERTNRMADDPVRGGFLLSLIRGEMLRSRKGLKAEAMQIEGEARKALEALGYL
ncbi:MAG TPA: sulfatase [Thermoanaerobaculia bacterium]